MPPGGGEPEGTNGTSPSGGEPGGTNGTSPNPLASSPSPSAPTPPSPALPAAAAAAAIQWSAAKVFWTLGVFLLAGLAEIGGGWLVWQCLRNKRPWYYFVGGSAVLVSYGVIPTLQPEGASFARVYAVYGGIFIGMSYGWGWAVDGDRPDRGDWVGAAIALAGVSVAWFWPRG
ncbi:hypothetical protein TSOC_010722 [Tetrabaena socialis]|uniref:Uncharacterized protein n=1 Tax=Tetrabaena socialis TaxID=47790 RepID=A0A2J7ZSG7_9CHLO|nr:hypothetical protein TSOC_010722 [Tetrabaena socialis]|eukprot:PNH03217.1 hypothetical protein TSOC_010722 [Tetrabaena socialis]